MKDIRSNALKSMRNVLPGEMLAFICLVTFLFPTTLGNLLPDPSLFPLSADELGQLSKQFDITAMSSYWIPIVAVVFAFTFRLYVELTKGEYERNLISIAIGMLLGMLLGAYFEQTAGSLSGIMLAVFIACSLGIGSATVLNQPAGVHLATMFGVFFVVSGWTTRLIHDGYAWPADTNLPTGRLAACTFCIFALVIGAGQMLIALAELAYSRLNKQLATA